MSQSESNTQWLSLSVAARELNVHPTTLRRWADEGQIAFMLTPGGHRRFAASDVAALAERRHSIRRFGPVERIWAEKALSRTREMLSSAQDDRWLQRYDTDARDKHRRLGQELMMLTQEYLTTEDDDEAMIGRARDIGQQYGRHAKTLGLAVTQALRASMIFRDALVSTAVRLSENVRIPAASQARLLDRINHVLNAVQLGVVESYDESVS